MVGTFLAFVRNWIVDRWYDRNKFSNYEPTYDNNYFMISISHVREVQVAGNLYGTVEKG